MRGQITIFFLIGIVLVIVVLLLMYVRTTIVDVERGEQTETIESKQYLTQCVENALFDVLDDIREGAFGEQRVPYGGEDVALGLDATNSMSTYPILGPLDDYGNRPTLFMEFLDANSDARLAFFGRVTLQMLCDPDGPNREGQLLNPNKCFQPSLNSFSIQENFSVRIHDTLKDCMARPVDAVVGAEISAYGEPIVEVVFGSQAVNIKTTFSETDVVLEQNYRVRILSLYSYATELLVRSVRDPRNHIIHYLSSDYYQNDFSISREDDGTNFLYTFKDTNDRFMYGGHPLMITFVVQKREEYIDCNGFLWVPDDPDEGIIPGKYVCSGTTIYFFDNTPP